MRSGTNIKAARARAGVITLGRLLGIRERREQSLRRGIAQYCQQQAELNEQLAASRVKRQQLCQQLRELTQWCGLLAPAEFSEQKDQLHQLYQQERGQQSQISELLEQGQQLAEKVEEQRALLQRNLREQEKLRILIEDESNRY
ncbi:type III secretion protein [Candidatus Fukatsuia symbiotica]|uniref:Type III secretion protein n=1 Tax=Candidatus Fukatsuia symbiotica TaxID=1878942 RepID=A0A2U8IAQ3_9GAMM|nr:type III secretion protein [Candidatus Fukatsuia symbiotica]AWK15334.1 type III secretion protein [Candidatus Fukatsuia symbiotica]MEA9445653.1 type III secretion protein [Candidatus Fukatsuia symbiotica]